MHTKLVIFGITGDLSQRKLLPVISELVKTEVGKDLSIVGVSRREVEVVEFLEKQPELIDRTSIFTMDLAKSEDYERLRKHLLLGDDEQALIYLAVPPGAAADIVDMLGEAGMSAQNVKILFEKPFGFDYTSADTFIKRTARYFNESQLYRIDHYMAKELALDIIKKRHDSESHHREWGAHSISKVEIIASETLGVEDRATFYEQTGALRDVVQGHLMQLLALILMRVPADSSSVDIPKLRLEALRQLQLAHPDQSARAQYASYQAEVKNKGSLTESFAQVTLHSEDPHWQGVPLVLKTGKKLANKRTAIIVTYHDGTQDVFEEGAILREERVPDAYERVLEQAILGQKEIFTTSDEVLESWRILAPIQEAWSMSSVPLITYPDGATIDTVTHQK